MNLLFVCLSIIFPGAVLADVAVGPIIAVEIATVLVTLLLVIALIWVTVRLIRRFWKKRR